MAGLLVLAACGGGDGAPSAATLGEASSGSTTTTSETTTTTASPEAAVERAFYEQWDAFIEILSDPDPANPLIDRHFTGPAKEQVLDVVSAYVAEGKVARYPDDMSLFQPSVQRIEFVSDSEARVIECTIDGTIQADEETGKVLDGKVYRVHFSNTFVLVEGKWKVTNTESVKPGEPDCDFD